MDACRNTPSRDASYGGCGGCWIFLTCARPFFPPYVRQSVIGLFTRYSNQVHQGSKKALKRNVTVTVKSKNDKLCWKKAAEAMHVAHTHQFCKRAKSSNSPTNKRILYGQKEINNAGLPIPRHRCSSRTWPRWTCGHVLSVHTTTNRSRLICHGSAAEAVSLTLRQNEHQLVNPFRLVKRQSRWAYVPMLDL